MEEVNFWALNILNSQIFVPTTGEQILSSLKKWDLAASGQAFSSQTPSEKTACGISAQFWAWCFLCSLYKSFSLHRILDAGNSSGKGALEQLKLNLNREMFWNWEKGKIKREYIEIIIMQRGFVKWN